MSVDNNLRRNQDVTFSSRSLGEYIGNGMSIIPPTEQSALRSSLAEKTELVEAEEYFETVQYAGGVVVEPEPLPSITFVDPEQKPITFRQPTEQARTVFVEGHIPVTLEPGQAAIFKKQGPLAGEVPLTALANGLFKETLHVDKLTPSRKRVVSRKDNGNNPY
jgi:hypothetical protein